MKQIKLSDFLLILSGPAKVEVLEKPGVGFVYRPVLAQQCGELSTTLSASSEDNRVSTWGGGLAGVRAVTGTKLAVTSTEFRAK